MNARLPRCLVALLATVAAPVQVLADFSSNQILPFIEDTFPSWIFQLLSTIIIGFFDLFFSDLFGTTA